MLTKTLSEVKANLPSILSEIEDLGESIVVTRSGRPAGVLLPVDEYEGLMGTLEILTDRDLRHSIRQGLGDIENGKTISQDKLWNELEG